MPALRCRALLASLLLAALPALPAAGAAAEEEAPPSVLSKVRRVATRLEVRFDGTLAFGERIGDGGEWTTTTGRDSLRWRALGFDEGTERIAWKEAAFAASWDREFEGAKETVKVEGSLSADGRLLRDLRIAWEQRGPDEGRVGRADLALRDLPLDMVHDSGAWYRVRGKEAAKAVVALQASAEQREEAEDEEEDEGKPKPPPPTRRRELRSAEWGEDAEVRVSFSRRDGEELDFAREVLSECGKFVSVEFHGTHSFRKTGKDPAKAAVAKSDRTLEWRCGGGDRRETLAWKGREFSGSWTFDEGGRRGKRTVEGVVSEDGRTLLSLRVHWEQEWTEVHQTVKEGFTLENLPLRSVGEETVTFRADGEAARKAVLGCVFENDYGDDAPEDVKTSAYVSTDWERAGSVSVTFQPF